MNKIVEYIPVLTREIELPMPNRLNRSKAMSEARVLSESDFPTDEGKRQCKAFIDQGYLLMSWPDGVRAAFKLQGHNLTHDEGFELYRLSRAAFEKQVEALLDSAGAA